MGLTLLRAILLAPLLLTVFTVGLAQDPDVLRLEESEDYYRKWLNRDVVFIISDEERAVFQRLTTPEEKEQFIEQFWHRRDPDPRTMENEFKEEHYRRIAYANERFTSGYPGWMTDRGRTYILHGPPDQIESFSGGMHERSMREGGGTTATFPYEIWRYRNIKGIGDDILLEFVDRGLSGEYRLALDPEQKDAFLHVPGAGLTLAEEMGLTSKADRPYFSGRRETESLMFRTARDNPFARYEQFTQIQAARPVKYTDLKELVGVEVTFDAVPFEVRDDYFELDDSRVIVPITVQVRNRDLSFAREGNLEFARVGVYGLVTSIGNRVVAEFEHDLVTSFPPDHLPTGLTGESLYQKVLVLDRRQRYRLDLVLKDQNSGKIGALRRALIPPAHAAGGLDTSSLVLTDSIRLLSSEPDPDEMFVLGDVRVRPRIDREFLSEVPLGVYFQVYNAAVDQSTLKPDLRISFQLLKDGRILRQRTDENGESTQYFSERRAVIIQVLGLEGLEPGPYSVRILVEDRLSGQSAELEDRFSVREGVTRLADSTPTFRGSQ
jgi:GWxTD domain-containing protein